MSRINPSTIGPLAFTIPAASNVSNVFSGSTFLVGTADFSFFTPTSVAGSIRLETTPDLTTSSVSWSFASVLSAGTGSLLQPLPPAVGYRVASSVTQSSAKTIFAYGQSRTSIGTLPSLG